MSAQSSNPLRAADPSRSAWVSANAGTGKTWTLASRVMRLLLDRAEPHRILCLTYTKAAASEMAGRLFGQLGQWAMLDNAALALKLAEIGAPQQNDEGLREARRLFAKALETPGGLKIQTIHSFCQHLLARFPLEAGVPPSFRVLDDQTAGEMRGAARSRVLDRAGAGDTDLQSAIAKIVTQGDETKLATILEAALGSDRRKFERFVGRHDGDAARISAAIRHAHGLSADDSDDAIIDAFCADMRAELKRLRNIAAWLAQGSTNDRKSAEALSRALDSGDFDDFARVFMTKDGIPRKDLATKGSIARSQALHDEFAAIAARFIAAEQGCRAARAAALAESALVLARAVHEDYRVAKRQHGVLDYDDLVMETMRLLQTSEAAAWVLYKLDGGIDHILIDEGQDTSPEQWRIVQRLAEEFFSGSSAREGKPRTIFVVGDEKQSIFSFQGADPAQFDIQRGHFEGRTAGDAFENVQLTTSRRSAPEILSFVDEVFKDEAARSGITSGASEIAHNAHRAQAKGRVEVWPTIKPGKEPETDVWQRPVDLPSPESPVAQLAAKIAANIKRWTDGHTRLPGKSDPIRPGDIMVLMPRREPFASELIRQLKQRNIPVAGADRIKLKNQIAVMDLAALGRFVLVPEDDLTLATVLRSPLAGLSEEMLFTLCEGRSGTLWSSLTAHRTDLAAFERAHAFLTECLAQADFSPPFEFYMRVLVPEGRRRLLARLGAEANDAIEEFLSLAIAYESLNPPSLEGFLHWFERGDAEVKRDMERGRNEVRVMTVHGAKGLEADIVILPDTTTLPPGNRGALLYTEDGVFFPLPKDRSPDVVRHANDGLKEEALREHRRLLYVALTRPRDHLYVCGFENKLGANENSWFPLLDGAARRLRSDIGEDTNTEVVIGTAAMERVATGQGKEPAVELPDWLDCAPRDEPEKPRLLRPSLVTGEEEPEAASPAGRSQRFARGVLIHTLLAHLPRIPASERHGAALEFLAGKNLEQAEAQALVAETLRVLEDPMFAPVFAANARAEVAITADLPEIAANARVNGRIDRLAVSDDCVLVVDYKTNRSAPADPTDVPPVYLAQMALYRAALAKIFPGRRIDCALVWTDLPSLMRLPPEILDAEIGHIRARLDPDSGRS